MQSETVLQPKLAKDLRDLGRRGRIELPFIASTKTLLNDPNLLQGQYAISFNARDQQMTDHEIQENRPQTQQHHEELWRRVGQITNNDSREEVKAILAVTEPVQSRLESAYREARNQYSASEHHLKQLYLENHRLYGLLQDSRAHQAKLDAKRKSLLKELKEKHKNLLSSELYNLLPDQTEYTEIVSKNNTLRKEITEINKQIDNQAIKGKALRKQVKNTKTDLIKYLKEALKKGLDYREGGISWIISEIINFGENVRYQDLPSLLDQQSKYFVIQKAKKQMKEPQNQGSHISHSKKGKSVTRSSKLPSLVTTRSGGIAKSLADILDSEQGMPSDTHIRKIYADTKQLIGKIIKDRDKTLIGQSSQTSIVLDKRARMSSYSPQKDDENNEYKQYQRILNEYPRNIYRTVLKMVFGFRRPALK